MRTTKKVISIILAVIMVIGTASTAFAGAIDTSKSVDWLIEKSSIADVLGYLLTHVNNNDNFVGTAIRLVTIFVDNPVLKEKVTAATSEKDVTALSNEELAKILVDFLNDERSLKTWTKDLTEKKILGEKTIPELAKNLGVTINLSSVDGVIKALFDICDLTSKRTLDLDSLNNLKKDSLQKSKDTPYTVANSSNLSVIKALLGFLSDNVEVIKKAVKGELSLKIKFNLAVAAIDVYDATDKVNDVVNKYINKANILDKMYRLVYGGAKDGDFANSMYKDYSADQLLAAGFIKMMKCINATDPNNKIEKDECNKALKMNVYELLATYAPVFLKNYKFKSDGKTIVEKLNTTLKTLIEKLKSEDKVDDATKARFEFKDFTNDDFDAIFKNLENDGVLNQFNNICCLVAKKILSDSAYNELNLTEGGNEHLNDNLTKICRYTLPAIANVGTIGGVDFSAFTEDKVKDMSLAEMGTAVLKLFFPTWFKDNISTAADAVNNAKTIDQLAVIAARLALTTDKWMKWAGEYTLKEPENVNLGKISSMTRDDCKKAILKMGAEVAAVALAHKSETTHFTLSENRTNWTYVDYINTIVNWGVNFIKGLPAVLYCSDFYDDTSNPFYKINVVLNELIDFSFVDAGNATFKLDVETLLFDKLLGNLFNMNLEGVLSTFKKNDNSGNILNGTIVSGVVSLLDKALTAMFEHTCSAVSYHSEQNLGNCKYRETSYSYCKNNGHYTSKPIKEKDITRHSYDNWATVTEERCGATEKGLRRRTCSVCKDTETETIIKNDDHRWKSVEVVPATATSEAYTLWRCVGCGAEDKVYHSITVTQTDHIKVKDGIIITDTSTAAITAAFGTNATLVKGDASVDNKIATGMKLKLDVSGTEITKEIAVLGDIDGDGKISVSDARSVLRAAVALDTLTGAKAAAGDVDFSGSITVGDARLVLRAAVSLDRSDSWMASFK